MGSNCTLLYLKFKQAIVVGFLSATATLAIGAPGQFRFEAEVVYIEGGAAALSPAQVGDQIAGNFSVGDGPYGSSPVGFITLIHEGLNVSFEMAGRQHILSFPSAMISLDGRYGEVRGSPHPGACSPECNVESFLFVANSEDDALRGNANARSFFRALVKGGYEDSTVTIVTQQGFTILATVVSVVPEPACYLLFCIGVSYIFVARSRQLLASRHTDAVTPWRAR